MNATMYGCEIVWPSSIGSGESSIGKFAKLIGQEGLAGNRAHGIQDQFGSYAPSENGLFDHFINEGEQNLVF